VRGICIQTCEPYAHCLYELAAFHHRSPSFW
jgi:hypothetical protein